ncbi:Tubulin/FtsZ, GTPase domain-containing protein [Pavlovales sp. CCMP2436]|nr:Tubulin/FtsZ, GTPase domain-containing protein [Pavlovales sp. CCMP2436]|mmetsp:Transcript_17781/g.45501  ORF Transcript_17781/g.45501 Transcript_17781/m.45501 type:complete len:433 (+) Transcript_17781:135-1433(+)
MGVGGEVITIQVGQCGNQVGMRVLDALLHDAGPDERFFRRARPWPGSAEESIVARAVLVDMEPKAVRDATAAALATGSWAYAPGRQYCEQGGSGNNWAHGYHEHGPRCRERIAELIRAELEAADRAGGVLIYQALAGGTGSGVGAHIAATVRDEWSELLVTNAVIWPSERGDVAVQPYNCALSLAALGETADAIVFLENDALQHICARVLKIARPSHDDLNRLIARHLVPVLSASTDARSGREHSLFGEPLSHLCAHPAYKLLATRIVPQTPARSLQHTAYRWPAVVRPLAQMAATDGRTEDTVDWTGAAEGDVSAPRSRALAHWLVLRGPGAGEADVRMLARERLFAPWAAAPGLLVTANERELQAQDKTAVLVSNSQLVEAPLRRLVRRACALFAERAYVHQYERHGMTADELCTRLAQVEQMAQSYAEL